MNTTILADLAKEESPTLVMLANRWMLKDKGVNPVADAILLNKADEEKTEGISCGFALGCISLLLVFIGTIGFFSVTKVTLISFGVMPTVWLIIYCIFWWRAKKLLSGCRDTQNLEAFCDAITTIECLIKMVWLPKEVVVGIRPVLLQEKAKIWEQYNALAQIGELVGDSLRKEAVEVKRIQNIPWKTAEGVKARNELMRKWGILSLLLLNLPTKKELFEDELATTVE